MKKQISSGGISKQFYATISVLVIAALFLKFHQPVLLLFLFLACIINPTTKAFLGITTAHLLAGICLHQPVLSILLCCDFLNYTKPKSNYWLAIIAIHLFTFIYLKQLALSLFLCIGLIFSLKPRYFASITCIHLIFAVLLGKPAMPFAIMFLVLSAEWFFYLVNLDLTHPDPILPPSSSISKFGPYAFPDPILLPSSSISEIEAQILNHQDTREEPEPIAIYGIQLSQTNTYIVRPDSENKKRKLGSKIDILSYQNNSMPRGIVKGGIVTMADKKQWQEWHVYDAIAKARKKKSMESSATPASASAAEKEAASPYEEVLHGTDTQNLLSILTGDFVKARTAAYGNGLYTVSNASDPGSFMEAKAYAEDSNRSLLAFAIPQPRDPVIIKLHAKNALSHYASLPYNGSKHPENTNNAKLLYRIFFNTSSHSNVPQDILNGRLQIKSFYTLT
jgi:hypothetical protein